MMMTDRNEHIKRFTFSGISCIIAGFCVTPVEVIKTRLQLQNELSGNKNIFKNRYYNGMFRGMVVIYKDEGIAGLYKGVTPSALREAIYSTFRLGAYEPVKEMLGASHRKAPLWKKIVAGATTGGIGSVFATPTDIVRVRMQGEGKLKKGQKPRYKNTFSAFATIIEKEGVVGLWRGVGPTVQRAMILTASQIPAYDHIKHNLLRRGALDEGFPLHCVSAFMAGFITALTTSPFDVIKTRVMNERVSSTLTYTSSFQSFKAIARAEGLGGFYKGFFPNWMRLGPHTIITFIIFEKLRHRTGLRPV